MRVFLIVALLALGGCADVAIGLVSVLRPGELIHDLWTSEPGDAQ